MADPVLHIKDSYFFELPKVLAPATYRSRQDFPEVWVKLDPDFQKWEFGKLYNSLTAMQAALPPKDQARDDWQAWVHSSHDHFTAPFDEFLETKYQQHLADFQVWKQGKVATAKLGEEAGELANAERLRLDDYLNSADVSDPYAGFSLLRQTPEFQAQWRQAQAEAGSYAAVREYQQDESIPEWPQDRIDAYNYHLSGKVLIPQPFGELRNLHEAESSIISQETNWLNRDHFGFAISKFMVIEVAVGLVLVLLFGWLGKRLLSGGAPRGKAWNLLEMFVAFIRDEIARPALDGHHGGEHGDDAHSHDTHTHAGQGHPEHGHIGHGHMDEDALADRIGHATVVKHDRGPSPSQRYTPFLCTIFFFILGCNLAGMLPWVGAPTGTWAVTLALAVVTLLVGAAGGMRQFGVAGYFLNQVPSMDLPWYIGPILKPVIFAIEMLGLIIKHWVLSVRLLANMLAGHMVLLAIMGIAFGSTAAAGFVAADGSVSPWWWLAASLSVVGCALLSLLELFVAFLQAYVFTLLSALFIGAAIHKH
ncbi:MAG: F0F1 ATP synthase subunit A [Pirellulaceae bacterium]